jgi:hypothetical protein
VAPSEAWSRPPVAREELPSHRVLQRQAQHPVVVQDRPRRKPFVEEACIGLLDVRGTQRLQALCSDEGLQPLDDLPVATERRRRDVHLGVVAKPSVEVVGDGDLRGRDIDAGVALVQRVGEGLLRHLLRATHGLVAEATLAGLWVTAEVVAKFPAVLAALADRAGHQSSASRAAIRFLCLYAALRASRHAGQ